MAKRRVTIKKRRRAGFSTRNKFWFDQRAAADAVEFIETFCRHIKGELRGQPLRLEDHERWIVEELFGWKRKDAKRPADCSRQYRQLWYEVPRKNNKSTLVAAFTLLLTFLEDEPGGEVYAAAGDKEQAHDTIFGTAKAMRDMEPALVARSVAFKDSIVSSRSGTSYKVLSSVAETKHGLNASGIVVDEVHVQQRRDLIDTLRTSTGTRRQPLEIHITTAGTDRKSICWELHERAAKVIAGKIVDDELLPVIYSATLKDDWRDPETWARANPHLGKALRYDYIEKECRRAVETPGYRNTFLRLHLNVWTQQQDMWLDMLRWNRCGGEIDLSVLAGKRAMAGLDLSSTTDLAALVLAFAIETGEVESRELVPQFSSRSERVAWHEGVKDGSVVPERVDAPASEYVLLPYFWVPEENILERAERDGVPYDAWVRDGWVKATAGNIIDYDVIRRDINDLGMQFEIEELAIDRWNATQITTQLAGDGFEVFWHGQGFASMGQPSRDFEALVRAGRLRHGAHPVLDWMAGNVAAEYDPAGFPKPSKRKSTERIDGIVAAIMATGRHMVHETDTGVTFGEDWKPAVA